MTNHSFSDDLQPDLVLNTNLEENGRPTIEEIPEEKILKNENPKPETLSQPVNPVSTICLESLNEVLQVQKTACSHLECIVCYDVTAGQVYSCEQDHLLCHDCKSNPNVLTCPTCRQNFENIPVRRNRLAEKMIGALK